MARTLKKKTVKKVNFKLQELREKELHLILDEGYVTNSNDDFIIDNSSLDELKERGLIISKLELAINFIKDEDKLKTRYLFHTNKFKEKYCIVLNKKDDDGVYRVSNTISEFLPNYPIERVTLSISKDTIFYNVNEYKLKFKKHLYLSKNKTQGFVFDFKTGKLKLYPGTDIHRIATENKKAFRLMLNTLGLEFITDEILECDWLNRIGLEKAIKYTITTGKDVIKEKLRYSCLEYTEHTASLLHKSISSKSKLTRTESNIIASFMFSQRFFSPSVGYNGFVDKFKNCINIDVYLNSLNNYTSGVYNCFQEWKDTLEVFPLDSEWETKERFTEYYNSKHDNFKNNSKDYTPLYTVKSGDFDDAKEQCSKLGEKINLSWSKNRLNCFHEELTWKLMALEAETLEDEEYYKDTKDFVHNEGKSNIFNGLELITTKRRLFTEGSIQHHCVFTNYEYEVKRKQYAVFSYVNKDNKRITIGCSIKRKTTDYNDNKYYYIEIEQMKLKRNDNVSREDELYIREIISNAENQYKIINYIGLVPEYTKESFSDRVERIAAE